MARLSEYGEQNLLRRIDQWLPEVKDTGEGHGMGEKWGKGNMQDIQGDGIIFPNSVKVLAAALHYSFVRCYHWVKDTWNPSVLFLTMACCCLVAMLCGALCDSMHCGPPGPSVQGISQARILEWVAISFSRGSSQPGIKPVVSCIGKWVLYCLSYRRSPYKSTVTLK